MTDNSALILRLTEAVEKLTRRLDGVTPASAATVTMAEAISQWRNDLIARDCAPRSIDRMTSMVLMVAKQAGWINCDQMTYTGATAFLASKRQGESPWANATYNQATSSLRVFGNFLRRTKALGENPFAELQSCAVVTGTGTRALTPEEARRLIECSIKRHMASRRTKGCSPLFWLTLFYTGLRFNEAASMRWVDVDLGEETGKPCVWTSSEWATNKSGRKERIPLHPTLLSLLKRYRECMPRGVESVYPMVPTRATWYLDRDAAGILPEDRRGRTTSPHSARKSFCTWLDAQSIPRGVVSRLARHATTITERLYIDHDTAQEDAAVSTLPALWPDAADIRVLMRKKAG